MKLPNELAAIGRLYPVSGYRTFSESDIEAIVRDCIKTCTAIDDFGEWGESAAACAKALSTRYGLDNPPI